jgi:hemerythrin
MSIQWREEMAIDHGPIDQDHRTLIAIINEFCDTAPTAATVSRLQAILDKLSRYTAVHFRREEGLQTEAEYPYADAQHHEHMELIRRLATIREQLAKLTGAPDDSTGVSRADQPTATSTPNKPVGDIAAVHADVEAFVHDWLIDHIIRSDLRMKPYVAKMAQYAQQLKPLDQAII